MAGEVNPNRGANMDLITSESRDGANDVGTLWTMRRGGRRARCALFARAGAWELRVLVDGVVTLTERCGRGADTFVLAETWKRRMAGDGWWQVLPGAAARRVS